MAKYLRYVEFLCPLDLYKEFEKNFMDIIPYLSRIYEYYICPIPTNSTAKIIITFDETEPYLPKVEDEVLGITNVTIGFDKEHFLTLNTGEKLTYIQNQYFNSIEFVAKKRKWSGFEILPKKHEFLLNKNLVFRDYFKKHKTSFDKQYKAQFYFEYDRESDGAFISIFDKNQNEKRVLFAPSAYCFFCGAVKSLHWIENEILKINYYNNRDFWTVNIKTYELKFHYPRIEKQDGHSYYDLAILYLEGKHILKDNIKGLLYLRKSAELNYKSATKKLTQITGSENH